MGSVQEHHYAQNLCYMAKPSPDHKTLDDYAGHFLLYGLHHLHHQHGHHPQRHHHHHHHIHKYLDPDGRLMPSLMPSRRLCPSWAELPVRLMVRQMASSSSSSSSSR